MRPLSPDLFFIIAAAIFFAVPGIAQDTPPREEIHQETRMGVERRPDLNRELGLTPDQRQRIRQMNQARKPLIQEAATRLREANRALDMSIYADTLNEDEVAARLRDFQEAQAEMAKLRFRAELELRKVLTPEQLAKFRNLRDRFGRGREMRQEMRRNSSEPRPLKRIRQVPRRSDPN